MKSNYVTIVFLVLLFSYSFKMSEKMKVERAECVARCFHRRASLTQAPGEAN